MLTAQSKRSPQPLVSLCIPSYNSEAFVARTLESVVQQTYGNIEIIITDDRSTDKTAEIVKAFSDPRVRLVENDTNLGIGRNWNKALTLATGTYVKLMGADDVLYPDCLRRQVEALENSTAVLAVCNAEVINTQDKVVLRRRSPFPTGIVTGRKLILNSIRWGTNRIGEPVVGLFRRDILARSGMFDPGNPYMIDLAFWAELLKYGNAFLDADPLAAFRISGGSVSAKVGLKQAASFRSFVRKLHADPVYKVGVIEASTGCALSYVWCVLRNLLVGLQREK